MNCKNNIIITNDFITNNQDHIQALDNGTNNMWDQNNRGNYWSDWKTPDKDNNGIVDRPYNLEGVAKTMDNYPLSHPVKAVIPDTDDDVSDDDTSIDRVCIGIIVLIIVLGTLGLIGIIILIYRKLKQ